MWIKLVCEHFCPSHTRWIFIFSGSCLKIKTSTPMIQHYLRLLFLTERPQVAESIICVFINGLHEWKRSIILDFLTNQPAFNCVSVPLPVDLRAADPGGGRSGHRSHLLVRGDRLEGLVSVWRQGPGRLLQRLPQLLGIHHCPQHHGAYFTIRQVSRIWVSLHIPCVLLKTSVGILVWL